VSKQVVAGMKYVLNGVFEELNGDKVVCEMSIWERAWLDHPVKLQLSLESKSKYTATAAVADPPSVVTANQSGGSGSSTTRTTEF
jgi:hypothetical protein